MVRVALRLVLCALPVLLFPAGDAGALSPEALAPSGTYRPAWQTIKDAWPPLPGFEGFGFIGPGACITVRQQTIDNSSRIHSRPIQICN